MPSPKHPQLMTRQTSRVSLWGFSVLELLVSLVILASLLAFGLTVFRSTQEKSANVRCIGNLRTIGVALFSYIADNNGEYPPNRRNFRYIHPTKGNPWVQDGLRPYLGFNQSGTKTRRDAGPWYCPSDITRPMNVSAHSYGQGYYLGADDRTSEEAPSYKPWWSKPSASPLSGQLIYLIDHDVLKSPKSTAGSFRRTSWPLFGGIRDQPPTTNESDLVDFRHNDAANALFVDGSVKGLRFEDLVNTKFKHLMIQE